MGVVGGNSRRYRANKKAAHAADPDRPQLLNPHRIKPLRQYHALERVPFSIAGPITLAWQVFAISGKFLPFSADFRQFPKFRVPFPESGCHFQKLVWIRGGRRRPPPSTTSTRPPRGVAPDPVGQTEKQKQKPRQNQRLISFLSLLSSLCSARSSGPLFMQNLVVMHDATRVDNAGEFPCESQLRKGLIAAAAIPEAKRTL